jgi:hypothetical protein
LALGTVLNALMMEAARTSETSANFYQTTGRKKSRRTYIHMKLLIMQFSLSGTFSLCLDLNILLSTSFSKYTILFLFSSFVTNSL